MAQIDSSIYNAFAPKVKSVAEYDAERIGGQMNQLNLLRGQQQYDETQRKAGEENALRTFQKSLGGLPEDQIGSKLIQGGFLTQGLDYNKTLLGNKKLAIDARNAEVGAPKDRLEMKIKAHEFGVQRLAGVNDLQSAVTWAKDRLDEGTFTPEQYQAGLAKLQQMGATPQGFAQWKDGALKGGMSATEQLKLQLEQQKATETQRHNKSTEGIQVRGQNMSAETARRGQDMTAESLTYQQGADGTLMGLPTKAGPGPIVQRAVLDAQGNPVKGRAPGKGSALSATAQKELFEANDTVFASQNVVSMLKQAKELSKTAYEGYGAKTRAELASRTGLGGTDADATINLDNIITGQALEGLRATFGGSPTEGERKILLDIQGSASMTRTQREAVYDRAEKAAIRRAKYNSEKAQSIRSGAYFGDSGASPEPYLDDAQATTPPAAAAPATGGRPPLDSFRK